MAFLLSPLKQELLSVGFVRKGNAMFRVYGDGVLQILKFERWRDGTLELQVGLQSMYSEMLPQWFTSSGCIPRYHLVNIIGKRGITYMHLHRDFHEQFVDEQLQILQSDGIPWLNSIATQYQLIEGICYLETSWGGKMRWNDAHKIAPYLYSGDYSSAEQVLTAILDQHESARKANKTLFSPEKYAIYLETRKKWDEPLISLLDTIRSKDETAIQNYLSRNYAQNVQYAKFCMK
ncbi:MAG: hypothetical protein IJ017_03085 [Oscillospiraceae bacterium]|nr:hypothetical protein [Oscillospiraceae bacterium]